jgi:hypothetical protein
VAWSLLSADLASLGYPVVCIDHPRESPYLALPGGGGVIGRSPLKFAPWSYIEAVYDVRVSDMKAFLEVYPKLIKDLGAPFHSGSYLAVGHSLGGASVAGFMENDDSILGGINMDGPFLGDKNRDLKRPFLLMSAPDHDLGVHETWSGWESVQSGWWQRLNVRKSLHFDFMDLPMVFQLLGVQGPPAVAEGSINKYRMRNITTTFVDAFFNMVLGKDSCPLDEKLPNKEWPDVVRLETGADN